MNPHSSNCVVWESTVFLYLLPLKHSMTKCHGAKLLSALWVPVERAAASLQRSQRYCLLVGPCKHSDLFSIVWRAYELYWLNIEANHELKQYESPKEKMIFISFFNERGHINEGGSTALDVLQCGLASRHKSYYFREWLSGEPEHKYNLLSCPRKTFLSSPLPLWTHQRQRTKSKAVPGHGGGGWLQRD